MDSELAGLEQKLAKLLAEYHHVRAENESLKRELARAQEPRFASAAASRFACGLMDDRSLTLEVTILGREYRVVCKDSERAELLQAVAFLDKRMREIRDAGKVVGNERIAVMAALNIAHELLGARSGAHATSGFDSSGFQRRISAMQTAIDRAMAEQDKLF